MTEKVIKSFLSESNQEEDYEMVSMGAGVTLSTRIDVDFENQPGTLNICERNINQPNTEESQQNFGKKEEDEYEIIPIGTDSMLSKGNNVVYKNVAGVYVNVGENQPSIPNMYDEPGNDVEYINVTGDHINVRENQHIYDEPARNLGNTEKSQQPSIKGKLFYVLVTTIAVVVLIIAGTLIRVFTSDQDIYLENCAEIYKSGIRKSGLYTVFIKDQENNNMPVYNVPVFCDMDTTTGGWTVFQRRQDGSVPFNRTWEEYKRGFGNLHSEFWLGNQWIAMMTASNTKYTLRIDLESFDNEKRYAEYKNFKINGEADKFRLNIGSYSGTARDGGRGLSFHNQSQFSTKDSDNDGNSGVNCALFQGGGGGFWYNSCAYVNLNSVYKHTAVSVWNGIFWHRWTTLKHTEMKLKPLQ